MHTKHISILLLIVALAAPAFARQAGPTAPPLAAPPALQDRGVEQSERDAERAVRDAERRTREAEQRTRQAEQRNREREREAEAYSRGQEAIDDGRYDRAVTAFARVVEMKGARADAALYWKAYAQNRLGQRAEALTTIAELTKSFPQSRYLKPANALEVEVRREVGQPVRPQDQADEEMKLMALQALQHRAPEEAIPMLTKVLEGTAAPRVKRQALFVLAQSGSPKAREVLTTYARGGSTPELQSQAIQYLAVQGGPESRAALAGIYGAATDVDVKRRILRAFMVAGDKDRLWTAAQGERDAELRQEAVRQLGVMGAHEELWQLYQKESSIDVRKQILHAMFVGGNASRMIDLAKTEQNAELRRTAVRNLGLMGAKNTGDALLQIYASDQDPDIRRAVVEALFIQENAASLVALARKEQDTSLKKHIVHRLSLMRSQAATDYMMELLK